MDREKIARELVLVAKDLLAANRVAYKAEPEDLKDLIFEEKELDKLLKSLNKIRQKEVYNLYENISYIDRNWTSFEFPFTGGSRSSKLMKGLERLTNMADKYKSSYDKYLDAVEKEWERINSAKVDLKYSKKK